MTYSWKFGARAAGFAHRARYRQVGLRDERRDLRRCGPLLLLLYLLLGSLPAVAQLVSPEVHDDRTVTFRVYAPNAKSVLVKGNFGRTPDPMVQVEHGVWEVTIGPLAPEFYSYVFEIDGADVVDRHNRSLKRWFTLESQFEIRGNPPLLHEQLTVPHGAVTHHIYRSESVGRERGAYVYTPPGYDASRIGSYPVLLLLHGFGDEEDAWIDVGRANFIADNLLSEGRIDPMVIVMPYGHPVPVEERRFSDTYRARNEVAMERDILEDLLPFVRGHYNVSADPLDMAIAGLSMGGGHSLTTGLRNLDVFAWIGGFSSSAPTEKLNERFEAVLQDVPLANERLRLLWIACGEDDFLLEQNERFREWLQTTGVGHTYLLTEGAHTWFVWRKYLAQFLESIFKASP